jgi:kumamolisin
MARFVPLPKSQRKPLANSRPAGQPNRFDAASLTVRIRSVGDLEKLEQHVYEEGKKQLVDRRYFTRAEFATEFGASQSDLDAVEHYASLHNLATVSRDASRRSIVLRGTLGDLLAAFPANVSLYHHRGGTYRGRTGQIAIPAELKDVITGIFGFDTRPKKRSSFRKRISPASGPGGENGQSAAFFAQRYNFPQAYQGAVLDGSGQSIGIIELGGGYQTGDLATYFQEIGSPMPSVSFVSVDGVANEPGTNQNSDGEVMLDVEVAGTVAPKANLVIYFAPNSDQGFIDAIGTAIHDTDRKIDAISISWGSPESELLGDGQGTQELDAYHELFVAAAALGITVCAATGDHGIADMDIGGWDHTINVNHPACDDHVLACGGTQIDAANDDVVWNEGATDGGDWSSGGGISQVYPVPAYQANANLPAALDGGAAGRGIPDIAMSATDYFVRVDSAEYASGGTSAVAPLMAALVALLNQAKQKNVGFLNPFLYAQAASGAVSDVTQGTNAIPPALPGYNAGPGWDACTGLGTPDGTAILNLL